MEESVIKLETAKLAKEKGFDKWCYAWYYEGKLVSYILLKGEEVSFKGIKRNHSNTSDPSEFHCSAPTQSVLQKWLREVHGIIVFVYPSVTPNGIYFLGGIHREKRDLFKEEDWRETYEEALEAGLVRALNKIK